MSISIPYESGLRCVARTEHVRKAKNGLSVANVTDACRGRRAVACGLAAISGWLSSVSDDRSSEVLHGARYRIGLTTLANLVASFPAPRIAWEETQSECEGYNDNLLGAPPYDSRGAGFA
jgi:hypothetical protein